MNFDVPLYFIVINDELFLEHLDSIEIAALLLLCKHDFTEVSFSKHGQEVEVVQSHFALPGRRLTSLHLR